MREINSRNTPYDVEYGSCESTFAKLLIYSGNLDPGEVTSCLEVEPTEMYKAGDRWISGRGIEKVYPFNVWVLSSENHVVSKDVRHHLDWLIEKLIPKAENLKNLQNHDGVTMSIDCVWWSNQGHGGPTLWPEQMEKMAALNLECSFDIYFFGEEDD